MTCLLLLLLYHEATCDYLIWHKYYIKSKLQQISQIFLDTDIKKLTTAYEWIILVMHKEENVEKSLEIGSIEQMFNARWWTWSRQIPLRQWRIAKEIRVIVRPSPLKRKTRGSFLNGFFSLFFPLKRWSASPIPGRADARREEKVWWIR